MKVLVQRVKEARCVVDGSMTAHINQGLLLYVSFKQGDTVDLVGTMAKKIVNLRIFEDAEGKMNKAITPFNGAILSISQFTLEADTQKGHRPSFTAALNKDDANRLYEAFNSALRAYDVPVEVGVFQAHMDIISTNDGPVTIMIERT